MSCLPSDLKTIKNLKIGLSIYGQYLFVANWAKIFQIIKRTEYINGTKHWLKNGFMQRKKGDENLKCIRDRVIYAGFMRDDIKSTKSIEIRNFEKKW